MLSKLTSIKISIMIPIIISTMVSILISIMISTMTPILISIPGWGFAGIILRYGDLHHFSVLVFDFS